jgi:hypothetical protein
MERTAGDLRAKAHIPGLRDMHAFVAESDGNPAAIAGSSLEYLDKLWHFHN